MGDLRDWVLEKYSKEFLPQSSSDFIFAIIIEEYGLIGGLFLLTTYTLLLFRIIIISTKAKTILDHYWL